MNSKGVFQSVEFSTLVEQSYKSHFLTLPTMGLFEQPRKLGGGAQCIHYACFTFAMLMKL